MAITQSSPTNKLDKSQKSKKRIVASVWLIMALLIGAATLALWMFSSAPIFEDEKEAQKEAPPEALASHIEKVTHIDQLNELSKDVKPISFDALVRELRDYPVEFKDSKYLKKNKGRWTVQVMDVSEHEIITDYLASREDRNKFAYFRYRDANKQPRYLLTYDVMGTKQQAINEAQSVNFGLPVNVKVIPEEVSNYLNIIENYELTGPVKDLSTNRTRQVRLQPTSRELAARRKENASQSSNTTNTSNNSSNGYSSSKRNDSQSNSSASSSQSTQQQSQPNNTGIRGSSDTSKTLSVQEERRVVSPSSDNSDSSQPKETTKSKEPTKAQEGKDKKPAETDKTPQKSTKGSEDDSITRLIDEKSQ